jgi:glycerol kinase
MLRVRFGLMKVLAIDQGTSATNALVAAEGENVLGESSVPVHPRPAGGGAVEHDPEELLQTGLPLDPYFAAPKMTWLGCWSALQART